MPEEGGWEVQTSSHVLQSGEVGRTGVVSPIPGPCAAGFLSLGGVGGGCRTSMGSSLPCSPCSPYFSSSMAFSSSLVHFFPLPVSFPGSLSSSCLPSLDLFNLPLYLLGARPPLLKRTLPAQMLPPSFLSSLTLPPLPRAFSCPSSSHVLHSPGSYLNEKPLRNSVVITQRKASLNQLLKILWHCHWSAATWWHFPPQPPRL